MRAFATVFGLAAFACVASCAPHQASDAPSPALLNAATDAGPLTPPTLADSTPRDYPGLLNVVTFHDRFYSGGVPEGAKGFDALARLGVKTIISVDGAAPDLSLAKARGLRYIHLPFGYDGFGESRKLQLTRAVRDSLRDGPVYLHCHHGKHRSACAAATVAVSLGWMSPDAAIARMHVSGTSPNYTGLFECAQHAVPIPASIIDAVPPNFPEISRPEGLVASMVDVDAIADRLEEIRAAGWTTPPDHPDLVPISEAGHLADLFRVLAEDPQIQSRPLDFKTKLLAARDHAAKLEELLGEHPIQPDAVSGAFALISASCKDCHTIYRDHR